MSDKALLIDQQIPKANIDTRVVFAYKQPDPTRNRIHGIWPTSQDTSGSE